MEWGPSIKSLEERLDNGLPTPALDNKPKESADMMEFISAFWLLNSSRSVGMTLNPISFSDKCRYHEVFEVPINLSTFIAMINLMDSTFLEFQGKKKPK